ncbi:alpha-2-macroglobulin family protein [Phreatobacter oligotrophus]|uniref:alpha-2-macroglobulin family protein n=1 Tax=Phreatobacter oligotrophus TaxID=1122261 RepID=UPI0023574FC4|nr:alpha-2-macroglobulin [Phreatobacter oligotrophus]MBX9992857.1 alpha-2-macroglobulin family protein [Phreatobacter oligotrophus]
MRIRGLLAAAGPFVVATVLGLAPVGVARAQTAEPELIDLAQAPPPPQRRPEAAPAQGQPQRTPAAAPAAPALPPLRAFQRDDLAEQARRFEASIATKQASDNRPIPDIRRDADAAATRGDFRAAARAWESIALRSGTDSAPWVRYSQALSGIRTNEWREREQLQNDIMGSAYMAYRRSANRNEEAFALAHIRQVLVARQQWRPAIDVARLVVETRDTPEARDAYNRLREQHGFRFRETKIDSDATRPRACFVFTEALKRGRTDFAPYIRQTGVNNPPITVEDRQICVDGLRHGERYTFQVREGLPSEIPGESLTRNIDVTVYVRDRTPAVRFSGRSYVLPRTGQRGLPVVTVNLASVDVEIVRMGDRSIAQTIQEEFPKPLESFEMQQLIAERGISVWKGKLETENRLNADVTTALPIDEAVRTLEPGVYVVTAKPTNAQRPPEGEDYSGDGRVAQWFIVSDLGLTALSGIDGVHGYVHSLNSAKPLADVEVRLLARNNEVLGTGRTDASGHVRFAPGLTRGEGSQAPALIVAQTGQGDYSFLNLRQPAFDLSDRGVAGREVTGPLDAFLVPERGIYRPGETIYLTALLRDAKGDAVPSLPLTLVVERPDGVEYRRIVTQDQGAGARAVPIPIVSSAPTGTWRIRAITDPRAPAAGEVRFMVEDFVPDRIAFELTPTEQRLARTAPFGATVDARYLFGMPGANLGIEGEVVMETTPGLPDFPGFRFGLGDEEAKRDREPLPDGLTTDDAGKATIAARLPRMEDTTRPLSARLQVRVAEPGGRAVERTATVPVLPGTPLIGVKPLFEGDRIGENETASFELIAVAADGRTRRAAPLTWQLLQLETRWIWTRGMSGWSSQAVVTTRRIADGEVQATASGAPARIGAPVPWGKYRLEVTSGGDVAGPMTTVIFESGYGAGGTADTPDVLEMSLDKPSYASGETMTVAINSRFAGSATVAVMGDRLLAERTVDVPQGRSTIEVPVGRDWGSGAYATVFVRRPLDAAASRMPGRAIGLAWFGIDAEARRLKVSLTAPEKMAPRTALRVPVKVEGLSPGEEARVTVAAVDLGILTITNYQPPKPEEHYLGQRRLSAEVRDLYGLLIDGMSAVRGSIRSGGDGPGNRFSGAPPAQQPLSLFSGILTVGPDGTAEAVFDIPDFNGTVRLMAMAWTTTKHGSASRDVIARDPVVVTATLPRVLGHADSATARLDLVNAEGPAGAYRITVRPEGPLRLSQTEATVQLGASGGRGSVSLPLAASGLGVGHLSVQLTGPNGLDVTSRYALGVRPALPDITRRTVMTMEPGQSVTVSNDLLGDFLRGSAKVAVSVGPSTAIDVPGLILALDRYPFGCTEQITSRALPLLYLDVLSAAEGGLGLETPVRERIADSIERILSRASGSGSFGLWNAGANEDPWLDAYVTDFLSRAKEKGYGIPTTAFNLAIERLRTLVVSTNGVGDNKGMDLAYAHYVLARNGRGSLSELRWLADTQLNEIGTPVARGQLGAALALMGDMGRAERVMASAVTLLTARGQTDMGRFDYGSRLRDAAAIMALGVEARVTRRIVADAQRVVEDLRGRTRYLSTQEKVWLVLAAQALIEDAKRIRLDVGGTPHEGALARTIRSDELGTGLVLRNTGPEAARAVVTVTGTPATPEPAAASGFTLQRRYMTLTGQPADIARVAQGTRLVVVLQVTEAQPQLGQIMLVDRLPAGFEIDNPSLIASAETSALKWLPAEAVQPDYKAFRDDRFMAAYSRTSEAAGNWQVAYMIRAVTPGRYLVPPATIEDMYRPERAARTATAQTEVTAGR